MKTIISRRQNPQSVPSFKSCLHAKRTSTMMMLLMVMVMVTTMEKDLRLTKFLAKRRPQLLVHLGGGLRLHPGPAAHWDLISEAAQNVSPHQQHPHYDTDPCGNLAETKRTGVSTQKVHNTTKISTNIDRQN